MNQRIYQVPDFWGNTPLHYAAISGVDGAFEALLAQGENPHIPNLMGATPLLMRELIKNQAMGKVHDYPLLAEVYVKRADIYSWWREVKPGEKWCFFNMYPQQMKLAKNKNLSVRLDKPPLGRRVFAEEFIAAGEMICEYLGEFYPAVFYTEEMRGLFELPKGLFQKAKRNEADYINGCIDGRKGGSKAALIGDGVPNVEFVPSPCTGGLPLRIFVRALTDIEVGEELTAYYMGHPLRYNPHYIELQKDLRKRRIKAILAGHLEKAEELFLRYLFHTPYLLIPLLLKEEISFKTYTILFSHLPEEVLWIHLPKERDWKEYLTWMGRALKAFSTISFPHTRLFFEALSEMSFTFEKRKD